MTILGAQAAVTAPTRPPGIDLRQLHCFVVTAEQLHFTRAAELLHVSQPALSAQIRQLELRLGITLFVRSTRAVALTDAGREFLAEARNAVAATEFALASGEDLRAGRVGKITIVSTPWAVHRTRVLAQAFLHRAPGLTLTLREAPFAVALESVTAGRSDAAILFEPPSLAALTRRANWLEPVSVALPAAHRLAGGDGPLTLDDLRDEVFVLDAPGMDAHTNSIISAWCTAAGFSPTPASSTPVWEGDLRPIRAGVGIRLIAAALCDTVQYRDVVCRPLELPVGRVVLVTAGERANPVLDRFVAFARTTQTERKSSQRLGRSRSPVPHPDEARSR